MQNGGIECALAEPAFCGQSYADIVIVVVGKKIVVELSSVTQRSHPEQHRSATDPGRLGMFCLKAFSLLDRDDAQRFAVKLAVWVARERFRMPIGMTRETPSC